MNISRPGPYAALENNDGGQLQFPGDLHQLLCRYSNR